MAVSYQPRYRVTGSPTWINFGSPITVAPFTVTVTGLAGSTGYDFDVLAINSFGSTASATVTATTKTSVTESPEGTTITAANETTQFIYDASLLQWSLTAGGQVATSPSPYTTKTPVAGTSGLVEVLFHNATVFVENSANSWYYWNGSSFVPTLDITGPITVAGSSSPTFSVGTSGVNLGVVAVTTVGTPAFSGAYSITGTDAAFFTITSGNLVTAATTTARTYSINLTATQSNVVGSPLTQGFSIVGTASSRRAGTRFPYPTANYTVPAWPYAYNSVWNVGIGSGALYTGPSGSDPCTANLLSQTPQIGAPGPWDYPLYVGASTDPVFTINWSHWDGDSTDPTTTSLHVPSNAAISPDSDAIVLLMDSTNPTIFFECNNNGVINRSTNVVGSGPNGQNSFWDNTGNGVAEWGNGNQHVPIVGADLDNIAAGGGVYRMLPCHLFGTQQKPWGPVSGWPNNNHYNCVWPARASDYDGGTGSGGGGYTGLVPFGSIIFIPPGVLNMSTWSFGGTNPLGLTQGGMAIAKQLQNYGWHDENTGGSFLLYTSWDVTTTTARTTTYNQINAALSTLQPYLRVMQNWMIGLSPGVNPSGPPGAGYQYDPVWNPSAPINGGGTYPPPPPYWDPSLPTTFTSQNTY